MARVVLHNVAKFFTGPKGARISAVKDVNLTVEDQEFVVLVGPSGCGKSTTLRLIAGLEEINGGTISIDNRVVNDVEPKDRDIAMVFQNYALYPHMTVYENMAFGLKLRKVPKAEIEQRVKAAAAALGLTPCLDRLPKALSGGQRQRVAVGRAIVRQPKVFLFDEPLSNLDAQMRVQMRMEISRLHRRLSATMIYVTHDQVEAMTMGDRIVVMNQGEVQQVADPQTLYNSPANKFVAGFIGTPPMNFFQGEVTASGNSLTFRETNKAGGFALTLDQSARASLASLAGQPVFLGLRPEHISEAASGESTGSVAATVEFLEPTGAETYLHLSTGANSFIARVGPAFRAAVGDRLSVRFDTSKTRFFDARTGVALV